MATPAPSEPVYRLPMAPPGRLSPQTGARHSGRGPRPPNRSHPPPAVPGQFLLDEGLDEGERALPPVTKTRSGCTPAARIASSISSPIFSSKGAGSTGQLGRVVPPPALFQPRSGSGDCARGREGDLALLGAPHQLMAQLVGPQAGEARPSLLPGWLSSWRSCSWRAVSRL